MSNDEILRVCYYEDQFLHADDFIDEQAYQVAMHRRHNIAGHIWGIAYGLELMVDKDGHIAVAPGLAIDGYGREIVLSRGWPLDKREFDTQSSEILEVWLRYDRQALDGAASNCDDSTSHRWREQGVVYVSPPDRLLYFDPVADIPEHRQPNEVKREDLKFAPNRTPPDDPEHLWPVFLGQIRRHLGVKIPYEIVVTGRPYVGLIGEAIEDPLRLARVEIGAEEAGERRHFAVFLRPENADLTIGGIDPQFAVEHDGQIKLRGDTTLYGDLTMDGGAVEFAVGYVAHQQPWSIYHTNYQQLQAGTAKPQTELASGSATDTAQGQELPPLQTIEELRIEMAPHDANKPEINNQVAIGAWSDRDNRFVPCLTVDDQCNVTIAGNLRVNGTVCGELHKPPIPSSASPEAKAVTTGVAISRLAGSSTASQVVEGLQRPLTEASTRIEQSVTSASGEIKQAAQDSTKALTDALKNIPIIGNLIPEQPEAATAEAATAEAATAEAGGRRGSQKKKPPNQGKGSASK
jgi:hypothetical protein